MHQLAGRLTALDPDASEALRVIPYFDELLNQRAGLESVVRGAAVLSGSAARLMTPGRQVALRVLPNGHRADRESQPDATWQSETLPDFQVTMWLERPGPSGPVDAMVLERATQAVRTVLERTRGRYAQTRQDDGELIEVLLDPDSPATARDRAVRLLGFHPGETVRAVAEFGDPPHLTVTTAHRHAALNAASQRLGIGPPVVVEEAAASSTAAVLALRLTAEGTPADPGPRVVAAEDLGAALLVAAAFEKNPSWARHPDVLTLNRGGSKAPWLLNTLTALSTTDSLRSAATALVVHHSSLQKRLTQIEKLIGWDVTTPAGKFRLQIALILRRLDLTRP